MRSGVAGSVSRVVAGLERAGHRVDLMSYDDAHTVVRDQLRLSTLGFSIARRRLREIDVIHLHGPAPSVSDVVLGAAALRRSMPPVVYTHHFTVWTDARGSAPIWRAYDAITRRLARAAAVVVATTPSYQEHLRTHSAVRVECIGWAPNVVPPPGTSSRPVRSGPLRVLVVGQMRTYKGHRVAIEAIAGLAGVRLTLAGSGPLAQTLWRRAGEVPNVTMVAAPSDAELAALYAAHDVILLPATNPTEAFGIALLEGMGFGCVPVASDLRGVRDVAGPTGRLVPVRDTAALRRVLVEIDADRRWLAAQSAASVEAARTYSWDRAVQAYVDLLESVARC